MSRISFGVDALLTRIFPGSLVLIASATTPLVDYLPSIVDAIVNSRGGLLLGVGLAYLAGEIINLTRELVYTVPYPLKQILYIETGIEEYKPLRLKLKNRIPFVNSSYERQKTLFYDVSEDIRHTLELEYDLLYPSQMYYFLLSYLSPHLSDETERRRLAMQGILNVLLAQFLIVFFSAYSLVLYFNNFGNIEQGAFFALVILFVILFLGIPASYVALQIIENQYVQRLLVDYYVARGLEREN
jgi:hypothetical protein